MTLYRWHRRPTLARPVLVLSLEGWIDAGFAAAAAGAALLGRLRTEVVASFDADALLDNRARRPVMHLVDGVNTGLSWPTLELQAAEGQAGRDVLVLVGAEPDVRWRAFAADVVSLAVELGTTLVVGFGAYPAPVPHTRPSRLAVTATSADLARRAGSVRSTIDVPAGAAAAVERRCAEVGIDAVGLWAQVPHYAAGIAYPAASAALLEGLARLAGLRLAVDDLHQAAATARQRLDALIANSAEHQVLVRQLEQVFDEEAAAAGAMSPPGAPLPSGDELAAELERFLRDQGPGDG